MNATPLHIVRSAGVPDLAALEELAQHTSAAADEAELLYLQALAARMAVLGRCAEEELLAVRAQTLRPVGSTFTSVTGLDRIEHHASTATAIVAELNRRLRTYRAAVGRRARRHARTQGVAT